MTPLCFHLLPDATTADLDWAIGATRPGAWLKVCKPEQIAPAQAAGLKVYYRPYLPDDGDTPSGKAWAEAVTTAVNSAGGHWPDAICFRNEMECTQDTADQYNAYRAELRRVGYKGVTVYGSFGVGNPDWPNYQWISYCKPDAIDLHEYFDLTVPGSRPYWILRHIEAMSRGLLDPHIPIYVGETGSDAIKKVVDQKEIPVEDSPLGRRGWQDRQKLTAQQEGDNLIQYAALCAPSVVAAFVFGDGGANPDWAAFHTWGTAVVDAIKATQQPPVPVPPTPQPPVETGPTAPTQKKGHTGMPAQLFQFDQGAGTYDCWVRCIESFFLRYGYTHDVDAIFQAGKGYVRPAGGEAATFSQVKQAITRLAAQDGVQLQLIDLDQPGQVSAALADPDTANPWTVIAGVAEQDLQPGQTYGHYIILEKKDGDTVTVVDSYQREDGNQSGAYSWEQIVAAMAANWDPTIDAIGVKLIG